MVDLGKIGIRNRGDHVAGNQYEKNDIVKNDGIAYFCLKDTSDAPTTENTEYWQLWSREAVEMHGATSSEDGAGGLVPKPLKGDEKKALLGDGTWGDVAIQGLTLTETLNTGNTSLSFSDDRITEDSTIDIYTDVYGVNPKNVNVEDGSLTLEFSAQESDVQVKVVVS